MALHMRIRAAGSICVICFTASMPPISGMMMSIVTRSGFSCWYFSTACFPFSASPTTVNPAWERMSLTIVRMNTASSQTSTVLLLTLPPLSDDFLNHCLDVEHEDALTLDLDCSGYCAHERNFLLIRRSELIYRHILNVAHIVHSDSNPPVEVIDQEYQSLRARARLPAERCAAVNDGHDRPAQVDEATHGVGRSRQPGYVLHGDDFAESVHLAREGAAANVEYEESPGWNVRLLFLDNRLRRDRDSVTHRIGAPSARRRHPAAHALLRSPRVNGADPPEAVSGSPAAYPSLGG